MERKNELTSLLKIDYPIVCAPMLGVTTPAMVAAIANAGGLGSLPVGGLSPGKTQTLIQQTKALTRKPFAVNLFAHPMPHIDSEEARKMQAFLEKLCAANGIIYEQQDIDALRFYSYMEQTAVLLSEDIPVVSFTFGVLSDEVIKAFKTKGVILNGTATTVREAKLLAEKGIDIITAQGVEAGGHRGTFLEEADYPQIGLMSLLPQIAAAVKGPVLAAGGIHDGNTIRAAFALGAEGVQVGTAFIACNESAAIPAYKKAVQNAADTDAVLTRAFSGRWARGLRNKLMTEVDASGLTIPEYPVQNSLTSLLRARAQQQDNKDFTNLWAGQSANKTEAAPAADIFRRLVSETQAQ